MSCSSLGFFPIELITNILSRLPVKSLLRFKSVSKPWLSLLESPHFIEIQLQHSLKTNRNLFIFARTHSFVCADIEKPDATISLHHHPIQSYDYKVDVLGNCNGLLAIRNTNKDITFWNPSTRKHAEYPYVEFVRTINCFCCLSYGFGYDGVRDFDYKFIRIVQRIGHDTKDCGGNEVLVFSLKNRCWRMCESVPYVFGRKGVFFGNALHWICTRENRNSEEVSESVLVSFDLGLEKFGELPLPDFDERDVDEDMDVDVKVDVLGGWLVLLCDYMPARLDVWVMKDYGVGESWVKLMVLMPEMVGGDSSEICYVRPLGFSKNGNEVLLELNQEHLFWFNLVTKQARRVRLFGLPDFFESCLCVESLVPLVTDGSSGSNG